MLAHCLIYWDSCRATPQLIHNKTVLLIDDVCDSGATLKEAGLTIAQAGAQWVVPVTLTKTIGGAQ